MRRKQTAGERSPRDLPLASAVKCVEMATNNYEEFVEMSESCPSRLTETTSSELQSMRIHDCDRLPRAASARSGDVDAGCRRDVGRIEVVEEPVR
jgi:hypothetical protein